MHRTEPQSSLPGKEAGPPHHEYLERDINIGAIMKFLVGLAVVGLVVHIGMWAVLKAFNNRDVAGDPQMSPLAPRTQEQPPAPRLQVQPVRDLGEFREGLQKQLNEYGWVDKNAGTVRIPIDVAMKRYVEMQKQGIQQQTQPIEQQQPAPTPSESNAQ